MHYAQGFNVTIELNMLQQSTPVEHFQIWNCIKLFFRVELYEGQIKSLIRSSVVLTRTQPMRTQNGLQAKLFQEWTFSSDSLTSKHANYENDQTQTFPGLSFSVEKLTRAIIGLVVVPSWQRGQWCGSIK